MCYYNTGSTFVLKITKLILNNPQAKYVNTYWKIINSVRLIMSDYVQGNIFMISQCIPGYWD